MHPPAAAEAGLGGGGNQRTWAHRGTWGDHQVTWGDNQGTPRLYPPAAAETGLARVRWCHNIRLTPTLSQALTSTLTLTLPLPLTLPLTLTPHEP